MVVTVPSNNKAQPIHSFLSFPADSPIIPSSTVKFFFCYYLAVKVDNIVLV